MPAEIDFSGADGRTFSHGNEIQVQSNQFEEEGVAEKMKDLKAKKNPKGASAVVSIGKIGRWD